MQGCNVSSIVFNICIEKAINECKVYCTGIKVKGVRKKTPRFSNDVAIIAQDEIHLKNALERLDDILKSNYKIKINRGKKSKLWIVPKILKILVLKRMTTP